MNIFNRAVDAILSNRARALRKLSVYQEGTPNPNGVCVYPFSQCEPPTSIWLRGAADVSGGICSALSSYWILHHANGGSLWSWLCPSNMTVPHAHRITKLMNHQAEGQKRNGAAGQDEFENNFLRKQGLSPARTWKESRRSPGMQLMINKDAVMGESGFASPNGLARAIAEVNQGTGVAGCYKRIGVGSNIGAHAMAAFVTKDDVTFFDPNFGEFHFEKPKDFLKWFNDVFWQVSLYRRILSGTWGVAEYHVRLSSEQMKRLAAIPI